MAYPSYQGEPVTGIPPQQRPSSNSKMIITVAIIVSVIFGLGSVVLILEPWATKEPGTSADGDEPGTDTANDSPAATDDGDSAAPSAAAPVKYDVPSGFQINTGIDLLVPLYDERIEYMLSMPAESTHESVFIVSYLLDEDSTAWDDDRLISEAEEYGAKVGKENFDKPSVKSLAGKTAVHDHIEQQGYSTTIEYDSYYFFDGYYLIQVGCQPTEKTEEVAAACGQLIDSMSW